MTRAIHRFAGEYAWLSNFYMCSVVWDGIKWPSAEHAYQAAKTTNPKARRVISRLSAPVDAKHLGAALELRSDWSDVKVNIMTEIVHAKFAQNTDLASRLISTGSCHLVEGNTWNDRYWGVCDGTGENMLGHILMSVRTVLSAQQTMEF